MSRASEAVALASTCPLPHTMADRDHKHETISQPIKRTQHLQVDNTAVQVAPYQSLPVAGPVITHHRAAALNVLEPTANMPREVRACFERPCGPWGASAAEQAGVCLQE